MTWLELLKRIEAMSEEDKKKEAYYYSIHEGTHLSIVGLNCDNDDDEPQLYGDF